MSAQTASLRELVVVYGTLGVIGFGGPARPLTAALLDGVNAAAVGLIAAVPSSSARRPCAER